MSSDPEWDDCCGEVSELDIERVEGELGIRFPDDYRVLVKACNGGVPSRRSFWVRFDDTQFVSGLARMLSLAAEHEESLLEVCGWLEDRPPSLVPFAEDGGGDFICFDFARANEDGSPTIVYWHRAGLPGREFASLARTFSEFERQLQ